MAKTRMKTTPTRMQKDALTASTTAAVVVTTVHAGPENAKRSLRQSTVPNKSTIMVTVPKRANSVSSATSSMSHVSDTHSTHSDTESPPPPSIGSVSVPKAQANAVPEPFVPRTLNSLLCKPTETNIAAFRNRKVYMITEKSSDDTTITDSVNTTSTVGQKRKMYLIMEENRTTPLDLVTNDTQKYLRSDNSLIRTGGVPKKLTLFADKSDGGMLTQRFEKILPEILNCIQTKGHSLPGTDMNLHNGSSTACDGSSRCTADIGSGNIYLNTRQNNCEETDERLPVTLPPKKNRTKIITTYCNSNSSKNNIKNTIISCNSNDSKSDGTNTILNNTQHIDTNYNKVPTNCHIKQISAATPVIVSATPSSTIGNSNVRNMTSSGNIKYTCNGGTSTITGHMAATAVSQTIPQRNINLSTDFLFLMKMLPKLESIPEPHKNNVKDCVERIITQNSNIFASK